SRDVCSVVGVGRAGSAPQTSPSPAGTTSFSESHQYLDDTPTAPPADNYPISLTLTDDDTGSPTAGTTVTVSNVAPTLSGVSITSPVNEGHTATLTDTITYPITHATFTLMPHC